MEFSTFTTGYLVNVFFLTFSDIDYTYQLFSIHDSFYYIRDFLG